MRILLISNYYPEHVGGVESLAATLAAGYRARGHEVRWVAGDIASRPHQGESGDDVPVRVWNGIERFGFPYPLPGIQGVRRIARQVDWAQVIHMHDCLYAANVAAVLASRGRRPLLITQHVAQVPYSNGAVRGLQSTAYATVGRFVLTSADQVVFETENVLKWCVARYRLRRAPLLIENGIDTGLFRPATSAERASLRRALGVADGRPLLMFVGRFVEKKGVYLLRALAATTPDWAWIFVGRIGDVDPASWGLANVQVVPPLSHPRLRDHYVAADLLVLPSVGEGFPVVAQEAMSCGTPALLSAETAAGLPSVHGLVFTTSREPAALDAQARAAVAAVCVDPTWRERVAAHAARYWDASRYVEDYLEALTGLTR